MKLYKTQISRPYKVEVYGLQDDYIGTLQSYNDSSLGRIIEPELLLSKDGTSSFTCSVPKYFISSSTNEKILNPRWEDAENGVLAENTRILKVFIQNDGATKVYPLIINKIEDKRDSHFAVYKDITASGLAFAELGKVGFKLELNPKLELEKDANFKPTINYWLDKVFPNVKDQNGKIIKWLTPWCYELRMDWTNYIDAEKRESNKIYEDAYVSAWDIQDNKLIPKQITPTKEKERTVECYESNKYNITQTLAETYEVFCEYEYKCSDNGKFIGTYYDEQGQVWQGKKVIFYNQAIKLDDPFIIEYQKNLNSISRVCETDEIYTKLYVNQIPSETMTDGYITIANTEANPLRDDFILNFDYLYEKGSITEYQKEFIEQYKVSVAEYNKKLITISPKISELTATVNEYKAELALCEKTIESAEEQLLKYQKLRDNEAMKQPITKNKDNAYSVTFVKSNEITEAVIRLEGAMAATISAYTNNKYETKIFDQSNLITVVEKKIPLSGDKNYYAVLDEYGYVTSIYTSVSNIYDKNNNPTGLPKVEDILYLELQYSPFNKYVDICNKFEKIKQSNENKKAFIQLKQSLIEVTLNQFEKQVKDIQEQKQELNNQLETILGPALREGHWQSEEVKNYEANNSIIINQKPSDNISNLKDVDFIFDKELFDQEETGYYYDSVESFEEGKRTYYSYIPIDSLYSSTALIPSDWDKRNLEDLILHLYKTDFTFVSVDSTKIAAGNYFIYYNSQKYYFNLEKEIKGSGTKLELNINNDTLTITRFDEDSQLEKNIPLSTEMPEGAENASNLTHIFEHLSKYLGDYKLYYNSGYTYAFAKLTGENNIVPIILLNNSDIDYEAYGETVGYTFQNVEGSGKLEITTVGENDEPYIIYYPRICISKDNVNYNSDLLKLKINNSDNQTEEKVLEKYKDYNILTRSGVPYITLKINKNINIADILDPDFTLQYQISQANEQLYQDALKVAKENAYPRFSYEVEVSQLPSEIEAFQLGQLSIINDYLLGIHNARGFISEITLALDSPKDDKITIQNYKTKFEDLFSTITATSEAMKTSAPSYDIAASSFATNNSSGAATIQGSILQNSFNQNKIDLIYSDTQVQIDDKDGITLTNVKPYENGIYGKVVLRGGGIFLSHSTNDNDERIWSTGITPNGINATAITTGTLDTNLIRVFAGDNMAFQWNGEGIYAYKRDDNGIPTTDSYVQYSDKGLKYIDNEKVIVDLGWDGLLINSQDGAVSLTGKDGLIVYDGEKDEEGTNHVVKLGRFEDEENKYSYGLRLYKKDDNNNYNETLVTTNDGQLWLKDYIQVGPVQTNTEDQIDTQSCGISGVVDDNNTAKSVRFWAGSNFNNRAAAPFRVLADGTLYANSAIIGGTNGSVSTEDIVNSVSAYGLKVISGNGFIYKKDSQQQTTLLTILTKGGAEINKDKLPEGANNIEVGYEQSSDNQNWEPITEEIKVPTNGTLFPFTATILMNASFKYRAYCSYYLEEKQTIIYSDVINFVELTDEGTPGRGIEIITEWYAASSDKNNYPDYDFNESTGDFDNQGNWSKTPPTLTKNDPFLWNLEVTKYTDGTYEITQPIVIGTMGEDGRSIESITNWYCLGSMEEPNSDWPPLWRESIQGYTVTEKDKYLWSYRVLHFTDGTTTTTPAFAIQVRDNGFNKTISNINLSYRAHNSPSTGPSSFYGSFPPTEPLLNLDNRYLWGMLTVWNSSADTTTMIAYSDSYLIYTLNADKEVSSISTYYLFSDQNTGITAPDQSWQSSPNGLNTSNTYNERCLWNFEQINYSDGSVQYTEPSIIGTHGEQGIQGDPGVQGDPGEPAVVYRIVPSATELTRNLREPLVSPSSIQFQLIKNDGKEEMQASEIEFNSFDFTAFLHIETQSGEFNLDLSMNEGNISKDENTSSWKINNFYPNSWASGFHPKYVTVTLIDNYDAHTVQTLSIPIIPSEEINELAQINNDQVIIADGKVYANSIAAYQVTAGKVAAGAIQTGGIDAGSSLYLFTQNESDSKLDYPIIGKLWKGTDGYYYEVNTAEDYALRTQQTIAYNYEQATGSKMKLTSDGIEMLAPNEAYKTITKLALTKTSIQLGINNTENSEILSQLVISADGISGGDARFRSLEINGRPVLGGAEIIVSSTEPTNNPSNLIWIKPNVTVMSTIEAYTDNTRKQLDRGEKDWDKLTLSGAQALTSDEVNYTLSIPIGSISDTTSYSPTVYVDLYFNNERIAQFVQKISNINPWQTVTFNQTVQNAPNIFTESNINMSEPKIHLHLKLDDIYDNKIVLQRAQPVILKATSNEGSTGSGKQACEVFYFA